MINVNVKLLKHMKGFHKYKNHFSTFSLDISPPDNRILNVKFKGAGPFIYW